MTKKQNKLRYLIGILIAVLITVGTIGTIFAGKIFSEISKADVTFVAGEVSGESNLAGQAVAIKGCNDPDGSKIQGDNSPYLVKSTVTTKPKYGGPKTDKCASGTVLTEYYCLLSGKVKPAEVSCPGLFGVNSKCVNGVCTKPKPICGNSIVENGEACDDGNTQGNDQCNAICTAATTAPPKTPSGSCASISPTITVTDEQGKPIAGATITLYGFEEINHIEKVDGVEVTVFPEGATAFPYESYPDEAILAIGKTDTAGKFKVESNLLINKWYTLTVSINGYLAKFVPDKSCSNFKDTIITLNSLKDYPQKIGEELKSTIHPVKVEIGSYSYWSKYEVENRQIIFPYVPQVREDLSKDLSSVDVTLKIISETSPLYPSQDMSFYFEKKSKNVKLNQINSFEFSLPKGAYYLFFTFDLYYTDKSVQTYTFYPNYVGGLLSNKPEGMDKQYLYYPDLFDSSIIVYPKFNEGDLSDVIENQNNINEKRINLVFLNDGFEQEIFNKMIQFMVQDVKLGFFNIEPYTSNLNKFNFWQYPSPLTDEEMNWPFGEFSKVFYLQKELTKSQKIYLSHELKGKTIFFALINDDSFSDLKTKASSGKCQFNKGVTFAISKQLFSQCLQENSMDFCFKDFQLSRIFDHELGHELGFLGEEYVDYETTLFNIADYTTKYHSDYNVNYRPNTYFPSGTNLQDYCYKAFNSGGVAPFNYPTDGIICTTKNSFDCSKVPWNDLVGNGCGEDGKTDCKEDNPDQVREIGCFWGGGRDSGTTYPNLIKPVEASIMSVGGYFDIYYGDTSNSRVYGLVNERSLCRAIRTYTGSVGGICNQLCLDGCTNGKKCIQGTCAIVN